MITVIYPFKNREKERVLKSIYSLQNQTNQNFNILFIDYGSDESLNLNFQNNKFKYIYLNVSNQPWNKSKAINYAVRNLVQTPYCFIADIDMIFHHNFIQTAIDLTQNYDCFYFSVAYLKQNILDNKNLFNPNNFIKISSPDATGMTVFKTDILKQINGFDEFFHFWGAEDTDAHNRIKNLGYEVYFYNDQVLMLHQWHKSYIASETKKLTTQLKLSNIIQINHQHLKYNLSHNITKVNTNAWGLVKENSYLKHNYQTIESYVEVIDYMILYLANNLLENQEIAYKIILPKEISLYKYKLKKILRKKVKPYYSLKQVNDIVLMQIVTKLHNHTYSYKICSSLKAIYFNIKK